VDATTAGLVGAAIGAVGGVLTTAIGSTAAIVWDRKRHAQDLEDARQARLLDRRLLAHGALYAALVEANTSLRDRNWGPAGVAELGVEDEPVFMGFYALLHAVEIVASGGTLAAARKVVECARKLEFAYRENNATIVAAEAPIFFDSLEGYRVAIQVEIGISTASDTDPPP
jgi:hypothetical protein